MITKKKVAAVVVASSLALLSACGTTTPSGDASSSTSTSASTVSYPERTVTLLVGYEAGGAADLGARAVAAGLERAFGVPVVVENRPGATGSLAQTQLVNAEPDGYTIASISTSAAITVPLTQKVEYTPDDYQILGAFTGYPWVYVVKADSPYKDAKEFFDYAKANPGKLKFGTTGAASQVSIQMERMADIYDTEVTLVPFSGASTVIPELLGGNIDGLGMVSSADIMQQINSGALRAIAVGGKDRVAYLPDTPTLVEVGYPELDEAQAYTGMCTPKGVDPAIFKILEDAIANLPNDPEFVKAVGEDYVIKEPVNGEALTKLYQEQRDIYDDLLTMAG